MKLELLTATALFFMSTQANAVPEKLVCTALKETLIYWDPQQKGTDDLLKAEANDIKEPYDVTFTRDGANVAVRGPTLGDGVREFTLRPVSDETFLQETSKKVGSKEINTWTLLKSKNLATGKPGPIYLFFSRTRNMAFHPLASMEAFKCRP
jgi:hypothetical protein